MNTTRYEIEEYSATKIVISGEENMRYAVVLTGGGYTEYVLSPTIEDAKRIATNHNRKYDRRNEESFYAIRGVQVAN